MCTSSYCGRMRAYDDPRPEKEEEEEEKKGPYILYKYIYGLTTAELKI